VAAAIAVLFKRSGDNAPHEWTSLTHELLLKAPDPLAVLKEIVHRLHPTSWTGSLATKLESRLQLLEQLDLGTTPASLAAHNEAKTRLKQRVETERRREIEEDRARSGRFE
jgi:type II secretory pathway component PulF